MTLLPHIRPSKYNNFPFSFPLQRTAAAWLDHLTRHCLVRVPPRPPHQLRRVIIRIPPPLCNLVVIGARGRRARRLLALLRAESGEVDGAARAEKAVEFFLAEAAKAEIADVAEVGGGVGKGAGFGGRAARVRFPE